MTPVWFAMAYNYLIKLLNSFISWIADQDFFLFQDISFNFNEVVIAYLFILMVLFYWKPKVQNIVVLTLLSFLVIFCSSLLQKYLHSKNELIVFHKTRHSFIGNKIGRQLEIYKYDSLKKYKKQLSRKKLSNLFRHQRIFRKINASGIQLQE